MAAARNDNKIFVYMGGDQRVPDGVRRARIHKSVKIVRARAFQFCQQLIYVEFHDGIEIIEDFAFHLCTSLRGPIKLLGVRIIKERAFCGCSKLTDVEFGDRLETIGLCAFNSCAALKKIKIPSVRTIEKWAFCFCDELSDVEFGDGLMTLQEQAFRTCPELKRIALPLKSIMMGDLAFGQCPMLTTVDLVGGIHQTVASFHMESWRSEMMDEFNRINQILPTVDKKTEAIKQWMRSTFRQLNHKLLKEATTLLELALWKANLSDNNGCEGEREGVRTTRGSRKRARKEICVTSGADIVIKNVLPFLQLLE